jgi:hypothetical protein
MDTTFAEFAQWATSGIWTASPLGLLIFVAAVLWARGRVAR